MPPECKSGWIIPHMLKNRWRLIIGDARKELPNLLRHLDTVDIFFHDSLHTYDHMLWEFKTAWPYIRECGILASDDVNANPAFHEFVAQMKARFIITRLGLGLVRKELQSKNDRSKMNENNTPTIGLAMLYHCKHDRVLEGVLDSIEQLDLSKSKLHLIFVDNVSSDGAHQFVETWLEKYGSEYASITHLRLAGSVPHLRNACLKVAVQKRCDYIFFVDSDVILIPDAAKKLLDLFSDERVFAVQLPYVVSFDRESIFTRIMEKYKKGTLAPALDSNVRLDKPFETAWCGMGATMLKLPLISNVGFFDEDMGKIEDRNLTERATRMGFKVLIDPRVQLLHDKRCGRFPSLLWTAMKTGKLEAKHMIRVGTWRNQLRGLVYWSLLLASIFYTIVSPLPLVILLFLGWANSTRGFRGLGKLIAFPFIALYGLARILGVIQGLLHHIFQSRLSKGHLFNV